MNTKRFSIGKVMIDITSPEDTRQRIDEAVAQGVNGYICVSNIRTVSLANKDAAYCEVMRHSYMNIPDGMPLVWCGRLWGCKEAQRSSGPDLFVKMMSEEDSPLRFFLLGDTDETLARLRERFPKAQIVGSYSPPFKPLEEYDLEGIGRMIEESGADIVWTSLTAPKQDYLASMLLPYTEGKLFIGVGAAFRFALGETQLPPEWIRKMGLSGLFLRRGNQKGQVAWYVKHGCFLLGRMVAILWGRLLGHKYYQ